MITRAAPIAPFGCSTAVFLNAPLASPDSISRARLPASASSRAFGGPPSLPAPGYHVDAAGIPTGELFPGTIRLLTPFLNVTGGLALAFGALFSAYVFMPKRRVLPYSLDPNQPGDQFLFNLLISPVAIAVNFVASLPGAVRALLAGRIHSRVPATILIAIGGFMASGGDTLNRFGVTDYFQWGKFLAVLFLLAGFLVSIEAFREIRVPFTSIRLTRGRRERGPASGDVPIAPGSAPARPVGSAD